MRDLITFYLTTMKTALIVQFQYPVANYFYMIGMIAEPVIYLVVWSTIAEARGGMVGGYTPQAFAAYYIVWTLVRNMNIVFTPYGWEWRIQRGQLSADLLRPLFPLHYDLAYFAGWKIVVIILWLPLAAFLAWLFDPALQPSLFEAGAFFVAIWGAYLVRTMFLWVLGLITLWTTRISAIVELYSMLELILSGRLVPMSLLPEWARSFAYFLPFQWTFAFPIEVLLSRLTTQEIFLGFIAQLFWTVGGFLLIRLLWHFGIRRFSAVGA